MFVGEKLWSSVGPLSPKDKTQLEERLRRVAGPSSPERSESPAPPSQITRISSDTARPASPAVRSKIGLPRPSISAGSGMPRIGRALSPQRSASPGLSSNGRSASPGPTSPVATSRPKSYLPSKLGAPKLATPKQRPTALQPIEVDPAYEDAINDEQPPLQSTFNNATRAVQDEPQPEWDESNEGENMTIVISSILSSDPTRSVDALKKIQDVLKVDPNDGPSSPAYRDLAEHTEGLIETIGLQMGHVFERPAEIVTPDNFRLAKHLIQTLNAFCDHPFLAESLTVDVLTSLLEELTLRLLETDSSGDPKVKDLSKFINMIILRLFATARKMSVFRCVNHSTPWIEVILTGNIGRCSRFFLLLSSHSHQMAQDQMLEKRRLPNLFSSAFGN